jgi:hypothetical protein
MEAIDLIKEFKEFLVEKHGMDITHIMYDPNKLQYKPSIGVIERENKIDEKTLTPEKGIYFKRFTITIEDHVKRG